MRGLAIAVLCTLVACGPVDPLPTSPAPQNACDPATGAPCSAFAGSSCQPTGSSFACVAAQITPYLLVVTVPLLAPSLGGTTHVVSPSAIAAAASTNECAGFMSGSCFRLDKQSPAGGAYLINSDQAARAGWYLGASSASLPVAVTFWPMWTPSDTGVASDARLLGLPLPPVYAQVGNGIAGTYIEVAPAPPPGTTGLAIEWAADLPPSLDYTAEVQVLSPYGQAYPDAQYPVVPNPDDPTHSIGLAIAIGPSENVLQFPPTGSASLTVQRADKVPFEPGWTVYLRDTTTKESLTSRATIAGVAPTVRLNYLVLPTQSQGLPSSAELVVEPPVGLRGAPELSVSSSVGSKVLSYPALPPLVHVSGVVQSRFGTPVSSTLLFSSNLIDDVTSCNSGVHTSNPNLFYEVRAVTADQAVAGGAVGAFSVDLPQGSYSVIAQPVTSSGYAKTSYRYISVPADGKQVCSGAPPSILVPPVVVGDPLPVSGVIATADGRPVANASVDFTPAAHLASGRLLGRGASTAFEDSWPRPFTTTTGVSGSFAVSVDPGEYDMTVRPESGSGFPWVVRPDHAFVAGVTLEPVVVPAPVLIDMTLHDPNDAPLAGANVQAFSFYNGAAMAIGEATTDATGHLSMAITTAFVSN